MAKAQCPYFVSRTNGKNLYINCSTENYINENSRRKEFKTIEARRVSYEINCCNDYTHCRNYIDLSGEGKQISDNEKIISLAKQLVNELERQGYDLVSKGHKYFDIYIINGIVEVENILNKWRIVEGK